MPAHAIPPASLLLTLDTRDPRLGLRSKPSQLPLCSRTDYESPARQVYLFDEKDHSVRFEGLPWHEPREPDDHFPSVLPERVLHLRPLRPDEDEEHAGEYVLDSFLGGRGFLRVGGDPIWIQSPEHVDCLCGQQPRFVATIGHESYTNPTGILSPTEAFYLGEGALYFFVCQPCQRVVVVAQST